MVVRRGRRAGVIKTLAGFIKRSYGAAAMFRAARLEVEFVPIGLSPWARFSPVPKCPLLCRTGGIRIRRPKAVTLKEPSMLRTLIMASVMMVALALPAVARPVD